MCGLCVTSRACGGARTDSVWLGRARWARSGGTGALAMKRRHTSDLNNTVVADRFVAPKRAAALPVRRRSGASTHLAWAGGGFLLGAVCWHMVGFWSFIDRVLDETHSKSAFVSVETAAPLERSAAIKTSARLISFAPNQDCVQQVNTSADDETVVRPCAMPQVAMTQN